MTWTAWWVNPRHLVSIANISSRLASNHELVVILSSVIPKSHLIWYFSSSSRAWWAPLVYVSYVHVWATRLPSVLVSASRLIDYVSSSRHILLGQNKTCVTSHPSSLISGIECPNLSSNIGKNRVGANFAPSRLLDNLILITFGLS